MKYLKALRRPLSPLFFLTTCHGIWNFYPDSDHPGLSRFTSRGYGVASCYIKGKAYVNNGTYYPLIRKDSGGGSMDTLHLAWPLWSHDTSRSRGAYNHIAFLLPVPRSFGKINFLAFNGVRFENAATVELTDTAGQKHTGKATLYFVRVEEDMVAGSAEKWIKFSGLFEAVSSDSIVVSQGRFDFKEDESKLNF